MDTLEPGPDAGHEPRARPFVVRVLPLLVLLGPVSLAWLAGLGEWLDLGVLADRRAELGGFVRAHPFLAPLAFVVTYAVAVALSLPGAAILTITAGFLFGVWFGALLSVVGATLGAVGVFLIARRSVGDWLRERAGPRYARLAEAFRRDGFSYLLVLRLIPVFPFWLVNLVPALVGMRLLPYTIATAVGIVPGSLVYAGVGDGLGAVLEAGGEPDLGIVLQPRVLLPILGLALLSLLPVAYRRLRARAGTASGG
jgi:uncharacterized membrane protein YdjX (TVP38/TMEM64 family)